MTGLPAASERAAFLRRGAPFDAMDTADVDWMALRLQACEFPAGAPILLPGASPDRLYFLVHGVVRLEAMGQTGAAGAVLAELVGGECFPLEALHEHRPVFSTFRAAERCRCLALPAADFEALQRRSPVFRRFCEQRSAAFLDSSRRIFHAHFSRRADAASTLTGPLSALLRRGPVVCAPSAPVREVLARLDAAEESSAVVADADGRPLGVFSLQDLVRRVLLPGEGLDRPVAQAMRPDPVLLSSGSDGHEAALAMAHHGVQQVLVVEDGRLVGTVGERDLFSVQRVGMAELSGQIGRAGDLDALAARAGDVRQLARNLMSQGVAAEQLTRIVSTLNDRLSRRVIELELARAQVELPAFCWIALGSEGRHEQTLCTDQDNGIVFDDSRLPPPACRERLLPLARRINEGLARVGFPLCKGGVMAGNPQWCLSAAEWRERFADWLRRPEPAALLNAAIFFDLRPLHGEARLAGELIDWLAERAPSHARFFLHAVANAVQRTPPIGFFRDFVVDPDASPPNTLDLKLSGCGLFVDAARIVGLRAGVREAGTARRLREGAPALRVACAESDAWIEAFHFVQMLRLRRQHELVERGCEPHNRIDPYELNELDRKFFLESLRQARKLQKRLEMDLAAGRGI